MTFPNRFVWCAVFAATLAATELRAQKIDLNTNGVSDVWEQIYGAANLDPNGDADGDGVSNGKEALAGTNPFDSTSYPSIPTFKRFGTHVNVTLPCALGKQYQLQSLVPTDGFPGTNWVIEATTIARSGTNVTLVGQASETTKFYRISISDVDTDGDGVNDWEEYQLGLDPTSPNSNGQLDGNGQPISDYAYAASRLPFQNVVTIAATDPTCFEPDPGQTAQDNGQFTITRGGFPLNTITVNLITNGPGPGLAVEQLDFFTLPRSITLAPGVASANISVRPKSNTNLLTSAVATMKVLPGSGYTVGNPSNASVTIYPSQTATGTGLTGQYYTNANATYANSANFNPANLIMTRVDTNIDFTWGTTSVPIANNGYYCVRWTGQIEPQYSETYFFVANTDDGVKLWINDQLIIDSWVAKSASDVIGAISLQAGVRYNLKMEYLQLTGSAVAHLSWFSPSQSKVVVPTSRLFPASVQQAPTEIVSSLSAVGFINQPFSFSVSGANSATRYTASGLPPGLTLNSASGLINGTPTVAGTYQVMLTASNSVGISGAALNITIFNTGSAMVREVWTNVPGVNISDIPLSTPASSTAQLGALEGITDFGDNYGERVRGYLTVPATGNYYFWISGSDSAELWISNDSEACNRVRRAFVSPSGTGSRQWNVQSNQKSGWLSLVAGQKYYIEVLHKAGVGLGDNWAVGWLQDPVGTNNTPSGVVTNYVLSPYYTPPASVAPGTLYVASMLPNTGVTNMAYGTATLRMSADNSKAVLNFSINGISSTVIGEHINNDPYLSNPSQIMFDISAAAPQPDGSFLWFIEPVGTLSAADVLNVLDQDKGYIIILTGNYPNGELIGHFERAAGSSSFTPPPAPPSWADDHTSTNAVVRFLNQATFGASPSDITNVIDIGYTNWLINQFAMPSSRHLSLLYSNTSPDPTVPYPGNTIFNDWWQMAVTAPDQLRQRVGFALSEIMVVSDQGVLNDNGLALASYYDTLLDNSFTNFRALLRAVTLTPAMGMYLNMQGNDKGSFSTGLHANENYAREIMQLFSIGLYRMWPDGSLVMTTTGNTVPTYDQNVINGFAQVFTGWNYYQPNQGNGRLPSNFSPSANYTNPMVLVPTHHDLSNKLVLDNIVLPAAQGAVANSTNASFDTYCSQDLELALDSIFYNQNVGPFICRQLIQRLVTSQPSSNYLYRVVSTFNDNGSGVRGDMQAVINAILLDYEARSPAMLNVNTFGKQREPLLRVTAAARAFPPPAPLTGTYSEPSNQLVYITFPPSTPHRLTNGETIVLNFTDTSGRAVPDNQGYSVTSLNPSNLTVGAAGISSGSYTQIVNGTISNMISGTMDTTNLITVSIGSHGLSFGNPVYLTFPTGGASNGLYQIVNSSSGSFSVETADATPHGGAALIQKFTGGGYVVSQKTNITFSTSLPHGLNSGDSFYINYTQAGSPLDGQYTVASVPDATHFTFTSASTNNQTQNGATVYPLVPPPFPRSGNVTLSWNTWVLNATDSGGTYSLAQTPLNSPTVFNFFYPDYKFPGILATAGLTTPEFQLTSDTTVAFQMNFMYGGVYGSGSSSTNGFSSFNNNGSAIFMDLGAYINNSYANNAGLPNLIRTLNSLLCAGQLNNSASNSIYTNTVTLSSSTQANLRDRVRSVLHYVLTSPDFVIQR